MQNNSGDSESAWNGPHFIFISSLYKTLFSVCRRIRVFQVVIVFLVNIITLLLIQSNSKDLIMQLCGNLSKHFW